MLQSPPADLSANAEVFITPELATRALGKANYLQEKLALQDLAACMADRPEEILPRLVDLALEATDAVSGGVSLYERGTASEVFRWHYLRGTLEAFNGMTTPRHHSPCGITLDQQAPVLVRNPERVYDWLAEAGVSLPEVLLVPLYLGNDSPLGTLWIVSEEVGHFDGVHARVLTELAAFVDAALRMVRSEEQLRKALAEQELLAREMGHRVKNLFAVTDSMIRLSRRSATTADDLARVLSGRLRALESAHGLVRRDFSKSPMALSAPGLAELIRAVVSPHDASPDEVPRISLAGPAVPCGERALNGLALIFHELATNASKYGAMTAESGRIDVAWQLRDELLVLGWTESGGPPVGALTPEPGFGSILIRNTVVHQFGGSIEQDWRPEGLSVTLTIPLGALAY